MDEDEDDQIRNQYQVSSIQYPELDPLDFRPHIDRALAQKILVGHSGNKVPHNLGLPVLFHIPVGHSVQELFIDNR